ncbi:zinc finger-like domain-containing protein [Delftia sp. ZNC0008]|uniref:zinc finger-like domain-containing protein n=1 Tax=Delftia sp. ZNC0008 TaxID=1339242 RepID=UPI0006468985|nr:zinc finger-like domain-containing protein [Delftia sp. ZNC0008]
MIEERYLSATNASNLADVPHRIGQVDLIKASGLSEYSMASHYLRLISKPTRSDMERMHAALVSAAEARGHTDVHESVTLAMDWLMDPRCKVCNGAGLVERKGKDHKCPKCKGEKFRKEPSDMLAMSLITYVQECRRAHSSRIFKRLH